MTVSATRPADTEPPLNLRRAQERVTIRNTAHMSWEPDAETVPAPRHDTVSALASAIALAMPLLLLAKLLSHVS